MIAAQPARTARRTGRTIGKCKARCPGGYACVCTDDVEHALHICQHEECWCHTQERYQPPVLSERIIKP